jgi:hypothetical protein
MELTIVVVVAVLLVIAFLAAREPVAPVDRESLLSDMRYQVCPRLTLTFQTTLVQVQPTTSPLQQH